MTAYTLFSQAGGTTITSDAEAYTFGVQFSVAGPATLTAMWWYSPPGASGPTALPDVIALYAVTGETLIHQETPSWSGAAGSGWVRAPFSSPPTLLAATAYKGCVLNIDGFDGNWYSGTGAYWTTGPGASGITSGPLSAPGSAGAAQGQDTYNSGVTLGYPASTFNGGNYWVDVEVTVAAVAGDGLLMAFP